MPTSAEYLYGALGLERPTAYAARVARENRRRIAAEELRPIEAGRRTGRTTQMVMEVLARLLKGRRVAIVVHNHTMKRYVRDLARTWLHQLGHDEALERLVVVLNEKRAAGCSKVFIDHVARGNL